MQNPKASRKALVVGIVAAVAILAVLLGVLLMQFAGGNSDATESTPAQDELMYDLYWNLDRVKYTENSESGMSTRTPEEDGYYHIRFFFYGEEVELKVKDKKLVNLIDFNTLMALEFDEDGIVVGVLAGNDLPMDKSGWEFFVQSSGGRTLKLNSSKTLNGMEVLLTMSKDVRIYDMSGVSGPIGCEAEILKLDRVYVALNADGEVVQVFLYERTNYMNTHKAECQHCGEMVTWYEWVKDTTLPIEEGHYQLQNDVTVNGQQCIGKDQKICLDLNGKLVTNNPEKNSYRIYSNFNTGAALALMDTSEEKTGTIKHVGTADGGACFWVRYGEFYMYGGTLDGSEAVSQRSGVTFWVSANAYAYMFNGEIIGGTAKSYYNTDTNKYVGISGGAVFVEGKFVMASGTIRDGYAQAIVSKTNKDGTPATYTGGVGGNVLVNGANAVMEINGGVVKNGRAARHGGNFYISSGAELTINGATISGGRTSIKSMNGGNIYVSSKSSVILKSGSILSGSCYNYGGNVFINSGTFTMYGGSVSGGRCNDWTKKELIENHAGRNITNVDGTLTVIGGRIAGGVQIMDSDATKVDTVLSLAGSPIIFDDKGGSNVSLTNSSKGGTCVVKVSNLSNNAKIGISAVQTGIFTKPTQEKNASKFVSNIEGAEITWTKDGLAFGRFMCVCGGKAVGVGDHKCEEVLFTPWTDATKLPSLSGNFFLTKDIVIEATEKQAAGTSYKEAVEINIDLNGHNYIAKGGSEHSRMFRARDDGSKYDKGEFHVTLGLTNSKNEGGLVKITPAGTTQYGSLVWLTESTNTFNMYAGTLDGSDLTGTNGGVAVRLDKNGGTFNMYGGEIIGGMDTASLKTNGGGAVTVEEGAIFNMYAGTVSGGKVAKATNGGNFAVKGTLNVFGGKILDGESEWNGGNIYATGAKAAVNISGGEIVGGKAYNVGGNVIALSGAKLNISGGKIYAGTCASQGTNYVYDNRFANVYAYSADTTVSGGVVSGLAFYNSATSTNKLTLSGNAVINTYTDSESGKTSIGLYLSNAFADVDESKAPFTGSVMCTTAGFVTNKVSAACVDKFISPIEGVDANHVQDRVFFGRSMCVCGGKAVGVGDHECEDVLWSPWVDSDKVPTTAGNYYLTKDIYIDNSTGTGVVFKTAGEINIDLNGFNYTIVDGGEHTRMFRVRDDDDKYEAGEFKVTIGLTDSVGGGVVKAQPSGKTMYGIIVWMTETTNTFNMYSGILDASEITSVSGGPAVRINGGTFNMYGGQIIGGLDDNTGDPDLGQTKDQGAGAVYVNTNGIFNMYAGTVSGGKSYYNGGNFFVKGTLNVMGGTITGGEVPKTGNGGNIYLNSNANLNISGGEISYGKAYNVGGNIIAYANANITVSGGMIYGGSCKNGAQDYAYNNRFANVYSYGGNVAMSGGSISGLTFYKGGVNPTLTLSNNASIHTYTYEDVENNIRQTSVGLYLSGTTVTIDDSEGDFTGSIDVSTTGYITGITAEKYKNNFISLTEDTVVTYTDQKIHIGAPAPVYADKTMCVCGGKAVGVGDHVCQNVTFKAWTSDNSLPTATGNYYLVNDVTIANHVTYKTEANVNIDMNGKNITLTADKSWSRVFRVRDEDNKYDGSFNVTIGLTNSQATGGVVSGNVVNNQAQDYGILVWLNETGHTFNLYNGTLSAAGMTSTNGGAAVKLSKGTFNMYGGNIIGGTDSATKSQYGGGVATIESGATFNLYAGTISGGQSAYNGGNFFVNGTLNVFGGTIKEGVTSGSGGNIYVTGTLDMSDGTICDGRSTNGNGGNLCVVGGTLNVEDGEISGGYAKNVGGNLFTTTRTVNEQEVASTVTISGGEFVDGDCGHADKFYNNFYPHNSNVTITGGYFEGFSIAGNNAKLTMSGDVEIVADEDGFGLNIDNVNIIAKLDPAKTFTGSILVSRVKNESNPQAFSNYDATLHTGAISTDVAGKQIVIEDDGIYLKNISVTPDPDPEPDPDPDPDPSEPQPKTMCVCGGKAVGMEGHTCENVTFQPWTKTDELPMSGNYYLTDDITLNYQPYFNTATTLNIDLNGHDISMNATLAENRIFRVYCDADSNAAAFAVTIGITDTATGGEVKMTTTSGLQKDYGSLVWLSQTGHTFNLYNGILDASQVTSSGGGVAVMVNAGTFNMYGGQIKGGTDTNTSTSSKNNGGGAVCVRVNGIFNLYGGTVYGVSTAYVGGSFAVKGKLNVKGGTITGGTSGSGKNGGSIFATGTNAKVTVSSGTITDGGAGNVGGNIFVEAGASLEVSGGTISGGYTGTPESKNYDNKFVNVYVYGGNVVKLSGGTIEGIAVYKAGSVVPVMTLSGDVQITNNPAGFGLKLSGVVPAIDDSEVPFTGSVVLTTGSGKIATTTQQKYVANFRCGVVATSSESTVGKAAYFNAEENAIYIGATKTMCVCGGKAVGMAGHTSCTPVEFTALTGVNKLPASGNYFLGSDLVLTETQTGLTGNLNIDLNGHNIVFQAGDDRYARVFHVNNDTQQITISLTDSVGCGKVSMTTTVTGRSLGALVWLHGGNHTFNLYNGILDASGITATNGVAVQLGSEDNKAETFNMYGGEIIGGTANNGGGSVRLYPGTVFNLYNGKVSGGSTVAGKNGGNFYITGSGTALNVSGGEVVGGYADNVAGNIYVDGGATLNVSGGKIYGGGCGNALQRYANVQITNGTANLSGGTVSGIALDGSGNLNLSGNAKIDAYKDPETEVVGYALYLKNPATIDETNGDFTGSVAVTEINNANGKITNAASKDYSACFTSTSDVKMIEGRDNAVYYVDGRMMCVCGGKAAGMDPEVHTCTPVKFSPWTSTNSLPTSGNYFLTSTVTLTNAVNYETAGTASIDLNGCDIILNANNTYDRIFRVINTEATYAFTLNITDSKSGGEVKANRTALAATDTMDGGVIAYLSQSGHTLNLYGGILDASGIDKLGGKGVAIGLAGGSKLNVYGGEIKGGTASGNGGTVIVNANSAINMYGGIITGGSAIAGGSVHVTAGTLYMHDGTITGGRTTSNNGGNIYMVGGTLTVEDGEITGGTAKNVAGNLFVGYGASVIMSGGSIYGGVAQNATAATAANYANVQVNNGTFNMSGGTISGITVDIDGTLTLSGSAVINTYTNPTTQVTSIGLRVNKTVLNIEDSAEKPFTGSVVLSSWVQKAGGEANLLANAATTGTDYSDKFDVTETGKSVVCTDNKLYYMDDTTP